MVAFGKKLKDRQIEEWQGYVVLGVMNSSELNVSPASMVLKVHKFDFLLQILHKLQTHEETSEAICPTNSAWNSRSAACTQGFLKNA